MLIKSKDLKGYKLGATDGDIGKVEEFYFDDQHWTVRYLVADTEKWLVGRKVLISPYALDSIDQFDHSILLNISKAQIEASPSIESDEPVSKQFEKSYYGYYNWPTYWSGYFPWGSASNPWDERELLETLREDAWDPHLRSPKAVRVYKIESRDGDIGKVSDFIIDDETWAIRYLVVKTGTGFNGQKVLVSPKWIESINWDESMVFIALSREEIREAPPYSEEALLDRDYESNLHAHYGLEGYWEGGVPHLHAGSLKRKLRNEERSRFT
jgi:hypothetical protein